MLILVPLFMLSGVLAYFLIKEIDKEGKKKGEQYRELEMWPLWLIMPL